jgi:hypothetical protein
MDALIAKNVPEAGKKRSDHPVALLRAKFLAEETYFLTSYTRFGLFLIPLTIQSCVDMSQTNLVVTLAPKRCPVCASRNAIFGRNCQACEEHLLPFHGGSTYDEDKAQKQHCFCRGFSGTSVLARMPLETVRAIFDALNINSRYTTRTSST